MSPRRIVALALLAMVTALVAPRAAVACRRAGLDSKAAFAVADAVFVGRVVGVHKTEKDPKQCAKRPAWCVHAYAYDVAVEGVWKGTVPARVRVSAGHGRGDCSFGSLGDVERWVFMASGTPLAIEHGRGTARASASKLAEMERTFGAPQAPAAP